VRVFSSNYVLYGDMSRRVNDVLNRFSPEVEVYSVDETFLDLSASGTRTSGTTPRIWFGWQKRAENHANTNHVGIVT
jgi:nucleotidyltransferase/DNA polymerase involved in DNA repair